MTQLPFEAPRKVALIKRATIALDAAGYTVLDDFETIPYATSSNLHGGIGGDLRSVDEKGTTHVFCIRNDWDRALPSWLQEWAAASHEIEGVQIYIVVEQVSDAMERSCKTSGAGLLQLLDSDDKVVQIVDPAQHKPIDTKKEFSKKVRDVRRRLVNKERLLKETITQNYSEISVLATRLEEEDQSTYEQQAERKFTKLSEWSQRLAEHLDEVESSMNDAELKSIEARLDQGPEE